MTTFIIVRHGESEANKMKIFTGVSQYNLSELGHKQAETTAEFIKKTYKIDEIYSSPLPRAYQTAEHTADKLGLSITTEENLREINGGEWDGMKFDELWEKYEKEYYKWKNDIGSSRCPGGESAKEVSDRAREAFLKIAKLCPDKTVAVFSHAMLIRCAEAMFKNAPLSELQNLPWVSNASVTIATYDEKDGFKLVKRDINEHLEGMQTHLPKSC